jgi:pRiA4b ORF-3-like protein
MLDPPPAVIYQLKITLRGISPLIWRRLLVSADASIADLHDILQLVMGWTNSHLHRFLIHGKEYGITYDGGMGFDDDPKQIRLANFRLRLRERLMLSPLAPRLAAVVRSTGKGESGSGRGVNNPS